MSPPGRMSPVHSARHAAQPRADRRQLSGLTPADRIRMPRAPDHASRFEMEVHSRVSVLSPLIDLWRSKNESAIAMYGPTVPARLRGRLVCLDLQVPSAAAQ